MITAIVTEREKERKGVAGESEQAKIYVICISAYSCVCIYIHMRLLFFSHTSIYLVCIRSTRLPSSKPCWWNSHCWVSDTSMSTENEVRSSFVPNLSFVRTCSRRASRSRGRSFECRWRWGGKSFRTLQSISISHSCPVSWTGWVPFTQAGWCIDGHFVFGSLAPEYTSTRPEIHRQAGYTLDDHRSSRLCSTFEAV